MGAISAPAWLQIHPEVASALQHGSPVVALESTMITHGLPRPTNLEVARAMEAEVRKGKAVPATVAVLDGVVFAGLGPEQLTRLAEDRTTRKASARDLAAAVAAGSSAGTTVAATSYVAHAAGIRTFATGGIGGVHRGDAGDVSADLPVLARTPIVVVSSGAKSILDLPRTLEWLETHSVPVLGWATDELPAFFSRDSGLPLRERVETFEQAAGWASAHWRLGHDSAVLVCVPCPEAAAIPMERVEGWLREVGSGDTVAEGAARTPYVLDRLARVSHGETLAANRALLLHNASIAAGIAGELARMA